MSDAEKTENGKKALLEELQSIRNMLDEADSTDADASGLDKTENIETSSIPTQIPLLQDMIDPEGDPYVPDALYPQNELPIAAEDSLPEVPDPDQIEATYSEYQDLLVPEEPVAPIGLAGFSPIETDEFVDLLIEEHVDEIMDLMKKILRDKLSLLMIQFRDTPSMQTPAFKQEINPPDSSDEDSNWNL